MIAAAYRRQTQGSRTLLSSLCRPLSLSCSAAQVEVAMLVQPSFRAAVAVAVATSAFAALVDFSPLMTPPLGPGTGANDGYVRQVLTDPRRGGYYACGAFGGLGGVQASTIAHVGVDGRITPLTGPGTAGTLGAAAAPCTAVALDPQNPDAVYIGLQASACGGSVSASSGSLCKWSWAAQNWTLVASVSAGAIRSIGFAGNTVYLGGDFYFCAAPARPDVISPNFCKLVGGAVMSTYNRNTGVSGVGVRGSIIPQAVLAIVPAGAAAPSWLPATGADMNSAAYVCGQFGTAGGSNTLAYLFLAANDATNASNTLFLPLLSSGSGSLDSACMAATALDGGARILFAGFFSQAAGVTARKMATFDGSTVRAVSNFLSDSSGVVAVAYEPVSGWLYAATSTAAVDFASPHGYMMRVNMSSGYSSPLLSASRVPGVQLINTSSGTLAVAPCSPVRASSSSGACRPLSLANLPDGRLVVAGSMEVVDGTTLVNGLVYWDGMQWAQAGRPGTGANDVVYASAPLSLGSMAGNSSSGAFLMGGSFTFVGGTPARAAAIVQPAGASQFYDFDDAATEVSPAHPSSLPSPHAFGRTMAAASLRVCMTVISK